MTDGPLDAPGMTPLGTLLVAAMERHGWSTHEVARQGGPSASTVGRLISPDPSKDRRPPSDANLRKLSKVLRIPLPRVEAAAASTRGWSLLPSPHSEHVEDVVSAMRAMDERTQRATAAIVMQIWDLIAIKDWEALDKTEAVRSSRPAAEPSTVGQIMREVTFEGLEREHDRELQRAAREGTPEQVKIDAAEPDPNVDPEGPEHGA